MPPLRWLQSVPELLLARLRLTLSQTLASSQRVLFPCKSYRMFYSLDDYLY